MTQPPNPLEPLMIFTLNIIADILIMVLVIMIIISLYKLISFSGRPILPSIRLRRTLRTWITNNADANSMTNMEANAAINWATIDINRRRVEIKVPVKVPWKLIASASVRQEIRNRMETAGFQDYLESEFDGYIMSPIQNHGSYLLIVGEQI